MNRQLLFTNNVDQTLASVLQQIDHTGVFVVADTNTAQCVLPLLPCIKDAPCAVLQPGDDNKTLGALTDVYTAMQRAGVTRHWLCVNVGGGVVTDLGGFAAATFKRGITFVNVPTTLLGAVDAAVGGKTGVNFGGLKNEIGAFADADTVIVSTRFFATLPKRELLSGYAEMLKHALIFGPAATERLLAVEPESISDDHLLPLLQQSVAVKQHIVELDPHESGLRQVLNLGHTAGHALESLAIAVGRPVPHGYAVAWGLVVEAVLSTMLSNLPSAKTSAIGHFVRQHYGAPDIDCKQYPELLRLMHNDKKSVAGEIKCTLLNDYGEPVVGVSVADNDITSALDIFRDLMGL